MNCIDGRCKRPKTVVAVTTAEFVSEFDCAWHASSRQQNKCIYIKSTQLQRVCETTWRFLKQQTKKDNYFVDYFYSSSFKAAKTCLLLELTSGKLSLVEWDFKADSREHILSHQIWLIWCCALGECKLLRMAGANISRDRKALCVMFLSKRESAFGLMARSWSIKKVTPRQ